MSMAPRYSLNARARNGGALDDELTAMTDSKYDDESTAVPADGIPSLNAKAQGRKQERELHDSYSSDTSDEEDSRSVESEGSFDDEVSAYDEPEFDDNRSVSAQSIAAQSVARAVSRGINKGGSRLSMQANIAMRRRKMDSPKLRQKLEQEQHGDADYADGATELYKHLENHRWREASERCRSDPLETKIWVFRKDKRQKTVLWRMLPIHTAILYRAPVYVILDLLAANPDGPKEMDDRKMLPVHMACRVLCKEDVLRVLLKHNVNTVASRDAKGRTPRDILEAAGNRDQDSRVLQKVAARNKNQLIKVLTEFEVVYERLNAAQSVAGSRWSRFGADDDRSIADDGSIVSKSSRMNRGRPGSAGSVGSRPGSAGSRRSGRSKSRSRSVTRDRSDRSVDSRRSRRDDRSVSSSRSRSRSVSVGRQRGVPRVPRPEDAMRRMNKPRLPPSNAKRGGVPQRIGGGTSTRGSRGYDDDMSLRSGRSGRVSRSARSQRGGYRDDESEFDDDDVSRLSGKISLAARGYDEDSVAGSVGTRRSRVVRRVERKPRGVVEETPVEEIEDDDDDSVITDAKSEDSDIIVEEDLPEGPLYDLWKDIENLYPVPEEYFDPKLIEKNDQLLAKKKEEREEAIQNIKYYDPPKELQKLLTVITGGSADINFKRKKSVPLPEKANGRRANALGALRALSKNSKNRLRLGRTKGVIFGLLSVLRDDTANDEERVRSSNTLMYLCVPKQNAEAIYNSDPEILDTLHSGMNDSNPRVSFNCCAALFYLSKGEETRLDIVKNNPVLDTLQEMIDTYIDDGADDDEMSVGSGAGILGSPSGIRAQGAPTTDEDSLRGCRLNSLKIFLAMSKSKEGAQKMLYKTALIDTIVKVAGTMSPEENLFSMAIFANLSRNAENMNKLLLTPNLLQALARGQKSKNDECRKCATLALQNLSCNKIFRRRIGQAEICLPGITGEALSNKTNKVALESKFSAVNTIRNLAVEPSNVPGMMGTPGLTASIMLAATDTSGEEATRYIAADALSAMSQWLDSVADTCIERNGIELKGRSLASMRVYGHKAWD